MKSKAGRDNSLGADIAEAVFITSFALRRRAVSRRRKEVAISDWISSYRLLVKLVLRVGTSQTDVA